MIVLINFVMTPLMMGLIGKAQSLIVALNFTLVIFAAIVAAERKIPRILSIVFGFGTLISIWLEFIYASKDAIQFLRLSFSSGLFTLLAYILIRTIFETKNINLRVIIGAMSGFILLGIIGGVIYEMIELFMPGSLGLSTNSGGYNFYYFSFISLTTVGYGDIVPRIHKLRLLRSY